MTTTISDTIHTSTGALANGTVTVRNPIGFTAADGTVVAANSTTVTNVVDGVLSVVLIPNIGSNPLGSYYLANYNISGLTYQETWIVPVSGTAVKLIAVRSQIIPYIGLTASFDQLNPPVGCPTNGVPQWQNPGWACVTPLGTGTVTSVGLSAPSWLAVSGSPVTGNGTLGLSPAPAQTSHQVIGTCGTATSFVPCALVPGDIPQLAYSSLAGLPTLPQTISNVTNEWLNSYNASTGIFTQTQPGFSNLGGSVACGQLPAFTGDFTSSGCIATLATVNSNVGSFTNATITVNAKGQITAASNGSGGGTTTNALTLNNSGSGAASGTAFNGSAAVTLSYNTLGAAPLASPTFTGTLTTPNLTVSGLTGGPYCLQESSGVVSSTGTACGSGGGGGNFVVSSLSQYQPVVGTGSTTGEGITLSSASYALVSNGTSAYPTFQYLPIGSVGSAGLSATLPLSISSAGAIATTSITGFRYGNASAADTVATATQANTLISTLTGCSTASYVYTPQGADCVAQTGGGNVSTTGTHTAGYLPEFATGGTNIQNSPLDDGVTTASTVTSSEPIAAPSVSTSASSNPGAIEFGGNTTAPTVPSNVAGWLGPSSATFTAYLLQLPTTAPSGSQFLECGTPSSGISSCSFAAGGGGDSVTSPNSTLNVGGTSSATTLDLAGSAGEIMAGATPALTYTPTLGKSGTAGTLAMFPATGNFTTTWGSAATASNTILGFATVPTTTDIIICVVSSTTCTLSDSGIAVTSNKIAISAVGTSGLSGTLPISISTAGAISVANATTSAVGVMEVGTGLSVSAGVVTPTFGTATNQVAEGGVITAGGPTGSATAIPVITYNAAGQLTAVSTATPAVSAVNGVSFTGAASAGMMPYTTAASTSSWSVTPVLGLSGTAGTISMFPSSGAFETTLGSAATASNTILFPATVATTLHGLHCVTASVICTLTDNGYAYNSIPTADLAATGTFVFNNAANTYSTGLQNFNSATLDLPSISAYAPTTASLFGYDSTNNRAVLGNGTTTSYLTWMTAAPTSGHLVTWSGTLGAQTDGGPVPSSLANASHKWLNSYTQSTGVFTQTQPADTDLTGTTAGAELYITSSAVAELATTAYSVEVSGATNPSWATPTANGQCFMSAASSYATTTPSFQSCPSGGGTTTNALTMNNGGSGAASGATFNGSAAVTLSYNTLGAAPAASPTFTGTVTTPLTTAGLVTTTSGGVLGSEANATVAQGGTGATTAANALINLFPTAMRAGDIIYCATYSSGCTSWSNLAGNNSGTEVLEENSSGVPSWAAVSGFGTVQSVTIAGTSNQITATGTCTITTTGTCTLSLPATVNLSGSGTLGSLTMGNATSGTVTIEPVTGALGTVTASLPANTGTIAELNLAQTFSATQTFSGINDSGLTVSLPVCTDGSKNLTSTCTGLIGSTALASSLSLTTPNIGAATGTSLLVTGIVDGQAPVTVTTGSSSSLGGTYNSGYTFNEEGTAGQAITYTLPTAAAGKQYCVKNAYNGSAANTGTLELLTSAAGQYIIYTDGTLSASGGYVISGGAAADAACVVGVDSTHWILYVNSGTWSKH
ncbi:MAG: hypothetical protein WBA09_22380 [Candidatus Acidiferrum sp.]